MWNNDVTEFFIWLFHQHQMIRNILNNSNHKIYYKIYYNSIMSVRWQCPIVQVLQNPHERKQSVPRRHLLRETSCERYSVSPLNRHRNSLEYVAFFEPILCDLFDTWAKITQEIRSFFVDWASVSTATGTKRYLGISSRYFSILRLAACSAAAPAFLDVPLRCEAAWVSGEVASQRRHFPACHAVKMTPSV